MSDLASKSCECQKRFISHLMSHWTRGTLSTASTSSSLVTHFFPSSGSRTAWSGSRPPGTWTRRPSITSLDDIGFPRAGGKRARDNTRNINPLISTGTGLRSFPHDSQPRTVTELSRRIRNLGLSFPPLAQLGYKHYFRKCDRTEIVYISRRILDKVFTCSESEHIGVEIPNLTG